MDPDPAIFVIDLQDANKKLIILKTSYSAYYFLKVHLHHFSKIISQKEVTKLLESRFFLLFWLMIEGSGSRRSKNIRNPRIRIRNTEKCPFFNEVNPELIET
jgi:hypothetical protein